MLHLSTASNARAVATALSDVLAEPLHDPMQTEWVAAPTLAMQRWLALELARRLGSSGPQSEDGVAANIDFVLPGTLRQTALQQARAIDDPWSIARLVWVILDVLSDSAGDERMGALSRLHDGATLFARARRLADLFDRYDLHRPDLIRHWSLGHDVDALGTRLEMHAQWQPHLWRLVRARISLPSPAERMPEVLQQLRDDALDLDLPPRLAVVGLTTLPGGEPFLELLEAVGTHRDVHLMMLDPSPAASARVTRAAQLIDPETRPLRSEDQSENVVTNPLLRSWGRPYRERTILLTRHQEVPGAELLEAQTASEADATTLLRQIQLDLLRDGVPTREHVLSPSDNSIQIHSCYGESRQVDAVRDSILHLLSDDPTLQEEDIVILCPSLEQFAPLIESSFGPSADRLGGTAGSATPRLRYRITDRSLRTTTPVVEAFDTLLSLLSSRASATDMLDFLSLPPVRHCHRISDDDLERFRHWIVASEVRWGFDGRHRTAWNLPEELFANSWRSAMDRLMMGVAVGDDAFALSVGDIAPLGVDGSDVDAAGRLADLVFRLSELAASCREQKSAQEWSELLIGALDHLFATSPDGQSQLDRLRRSLVELDLEARIGESPSTRPLSFAEIRQVLAPRLEGTPGRSNFFRGGITVSSLTPLRWLPYRIVCLLGIDEAALGTGVVDADDLAALAPMIGDRDPRAEMRQSLLEAVIATQDHLVIGHTGRSVLTNQRVPDAIALAELKDLLSRTVDDESAKALSGQVFIAHPRQANDARNFSGGEIVRSLPTWSFDAEALKGAVARARRSHEGEPFLAGPLEPEEQDQNIALGDLHDFLRHPVEAFLRQRLRLYLVAEDRALDDELMLALDGRKESDLGERLIRARAAGISTGAWQAYESARGSLPVADFGAHDLERIRTSASELLETAEGLRVDFTENTRHQIDLRLSDGSRILGVVRGRCGRDEPGPAIVTYRRGSATRRLAAWLDLVVLVASDPTTPWRSIAVSRGETGGDPIEVMELRCSGEGQDERRARALAALEVVLDCYRRGLREPLPLFSNLSEKLAIGIAKPENWKRRAGAGEEPWGDGVDASNVRVFGDLSFEQVCAIPASAHDPSGVASGRAERYARYLYDAVASTLHSDAAKADA